MKIDDKNTDDFDLGPFTSDDSDFDNLFDDVETASKEIPEIQPLHEEPARIIVNIEDESPKKSPPVPGRKRTAEDFEPDMDALLLTAQSPMIIEGMEYYDKKQFSAETHRIYTEALNGVDLYVKILIRNPKNYRKLKSQIDADPDCQQVEKIAFGLFHKEYERIPETDKEKLEAFALFKHIFKQSIDKAAINKSIKTIRKYFLLSGDIDYEKFHKYLENDSAGTGRDLNHFHRHLRLALAMLKKGDSEITKGLKGRDLNFFIIKSSELLGYYHKLHENIKSSDYFYRIHNIYKKYYIIKE